MSDWSDLGLLALEIPSPSGQAYQGPLQRQTPSYTEDLVYQSRNNPRPKSTIPIAQSQIIPLTPSLSALPLLKPANHSPADSLKLLFLKLTSHIAGLICSVSPCLTSTSPALAKANGTSSGASSSVPAYPEEGTKVPRILEVQGVVRGLMRKGKVRKERTRTRTRTKKIPMRIVGA